MKIIFCIIIILLLQIIVLFPSTFCRILPPNELQGTRASAQSAAPSNSLMQAETGRSYMVVNRVGSRPPNCEHKCNGCNPCFAIKVPTVTGRIGIQYANYEPESWKCKCGLSIYSP